MSDDRSSGATGLLPCPFCGSRNNKLYDRGSMAWVACIDCGLEAPSETGVMIDQAITYWNTRDVAQAGPETVQRYTDYEGNTVPIEQARVLRGVAYSAPEPEGIQWRRINGEPFEYAIQSGPHGEGFVELFDGTCLRRALAVSSTDRGCGDPSCKDPDCTYGQEPVTDDELLELAAAAWETQTSHPWYTDALAAAVYAVRQRLTSS